MNTYAENKTFGVVVKETKKRNSFISFFKKITESLGRVGKSLMFPIAVLPIAALLNRLGAQIPSNTDVVNAPAFVHFVQTMLSAAGNTIFNNLHILFAIGVGFGLTKNNRGEAGLTAFVGMVLLILIMSKEGANLPNQIYGSIQFPIDQNSLNAGQIPIDAQGFERIFGNSYDKILANNVLNGIIAGSLVAFIYNRFHDVELPKVLGFFSGKRLIPVLVILSMLAFGTLYAIIFPWIGWLLYQISIGLSSATGNRWGNAAIAGTYGFINRLLIPFGLHHVPNTLFWFVLGQHPGTNGSGDVFGDINIFLNGQALGNTAGTFQSGFFPIMMFGLPILSLVFYKNAENKEQKQRVLSMFLPLSLISFLTGITEPIEFAFMFISPLLYIVHAILTGIFAFITGAFGIQIGFGFSAGLIDYLLSIPKSLEIIKDNRTGVSAIFANPVWLIPIGAICSASYFFISDTLIKKMNLSTPGRGNNLLLNDGQESLTESAYNSNKLSTKLKKIVLGLGGWDNIENYQNCVTRLRYDVKNMGLINESLLKEGGAAGVKKFDKHHIHVIIGTNAEIVNNEIIKHKFSNLEINNKENNNILIDNTNNVSLLSKPITIKSIISGKVISLDKMEDGVFSTMGKGIAIIPKNSKVISSSKVKLDLSYDTGHAFAFDYDGIKLLMHIGIETNKINATKSKGEKLEVFDSKYIGQENIWLKKDETIVSIDLKKLKEMKYDNTTALVILNESIENCDVNILVKENQNINIGDPLFKIIPKKDIKNKS